MITTGLIRSSWIVSTALQETTRQWPRLSAAAQILIASIPVVAVALLAVLTFFFILWDFKKQRVMIERGITPKPRNVDDKLLLIGIVSLFVGIGLLVFFSLKTGLSKNYALYKRLMEKLKKNEFDSEPVLTAGFFVQL